MMRRILLTLTLLLLTNLAVAQQVIGPYSYDGAGNIRSIGSDVYVYDAVSRLKSATVAHAPVNGQGVARSQVYRYDRYGNMTHLTDPDPNVTPVPQPPLVSDVVDARSNRIKLWSYDARGNVTGEEGSTYTWDAVGTMTSRRVPGDGVDPALHDRATYVYTAGDERIALIKTNKTTDWTVRDLENRVVRTYTEGVPDGSGRGTFTWTEDYVHAAGRTLASIRPSGVVRYMHQDHLGTTRAVTDKAGVLVRHHDYYPFGQEATTATDNDHRLKFTGHERDYGTNASDARVLDYMHARYYGVRSGRFLSIDPLLDRRKAAESPQRWNRYSYVMNNPLTKIDPDGRADRRTDEEKRMLEDPDVLKSMAQVIKKTHYEQRLENRNEAGTIIVKAQTADGTNDYSTTPVTVGTLTNVQVAQVTNGVVVGTGRTAAGAVHSHAGTGNVVRNGQRERLQGDRPSEPDIRNAAQRGVPTYIINENKEIIRHDPATGDNTVILNGRDYRAYRARAYAEDE